VHARGQAQPAALTNLLVPQEVPSLLPVPPSSDVTAYVRSPAKGLWTAPDGHTEADDVVMVEVVTETFDRGWWRTYAAKLAPTLPGTNLAASPVSMASTSPKRE
jgi:hypothetical protein